MRYVSYTFVLLILIVQLAACKGGGLSADEATKVTALSGLPRVDYARGGVNFSLGQIDGLKKVGQDSVPWASYMMDSDSNGQLGYYLSWLQNGIGIAADQA